MSVNYSLHITSVKVKQDLVQAYWTKTGTDLATNKTADFSGCAHFNLQDFADATPTLEAVYQKVETFINENILSTVTQKILDKLNS